MTNPQTHHLPLEVAVRIVAELAQAGVEGAVAGALVPGPELDVVDGDEASVPPALVSLRLGDGLEQQLDRGGERLLVLCYPPCSPCAPRGRCTAPGPPSSGPGCRQSGWPAPGNKETKILIL